MKRLTAAVLVVFLVLAAVGYVLLATEIGLTWLVRGVERGVGGLKIGPASGSVLGGFSLKDLSYRDERLSIDLRELEIEWRPRALLHRTLHLDAVRLRDVRVLQIAEAAPEPKAARLPDLRLPLDIAIDEIEIRDASWQSSESAEPIRLERIDAGLKLREGRMMVERFTVKTPKVNASLGGTIAPGEERPIDLDTAWNVELPDRPKIAGGGRITGDLERISTVQRITAPTAMRVTAEVLIRENSRAWNAEVDLPEFPLDRLDRDWKAWRFSAQLKGEGTSRTAKVSGDFALTVPDVGQARGRLDLSYRGPGELALEALILRLPETGTEIAISGQVRGLQETPEIDLEARWKNLLWPPQADGAWRSPEGRLTVAGTRSDVRVELDGLIRDQRVQAKGNIGFPEDAVVFRDFRVNSVSTALVVDGAWGPQLNLRWTLRSDDLGIWLPGAKGRMTSSGKLEGARSAPAVEAELNAAGLKYQEYGVRDLSLTLNAGAAPNAPLTFDLQGNSVRFDTYTMDIGLSGRGSRERHELTGRIDSPPYALAFEAEGGLREDAWSGVLSRFDLKEPRSGSWTLREPARLKLGRTRSEIEEICLTNRDARWCFEGEIAEGGEWWAAARVSGVPLKLFGAELPEPMPISGMLEGSAVLRGKDDLIDQGILDLDAEGLAFDLTVNESKKVRIRPETASIYADLSGQILTMQVGIRQAGLLDIQGALESRGTFRLAELQDLPVSGRLTVDLETLAVFEPWLAQIEGLSGSFRADLGIEGTARAPLLDLEASVPDAGFRVPQLGIGIEHLTLRANSVDQRQIRLEGSAMSGGGTVRMSGLWRLDGTAGWPLNLNLDGTRFLGVDTPEAKVYLSPDINIMTERQRIDMRGRVDVPEAFINVPKKEQAVTPSEDVVLVNGEPGEEETEFRLHSDVQVVLGDKIQVKAAGFQGEIGGRVRIVQEPNEEARGTGQIVVQDGTYSFYGVDLTIDDGRLIFTDTPVDNPGLDVTVTRRLDQVVAGVRVLGSLKNPNVSLYSIPPLPEADILAYLIAGKPMDFAPREEGDRLRNAASSLGGAAGSLLAREISSRFGLGGLLDEIGVGTPNGTETTSLFLGKYLTPRLYLQYGLGIFQSSNVFKLRYKLNEHWRLQSETGEQSGADILFEWER
ncbi:translocation/assembly module TamB domain-containing protein [Methylocaldum sp. 14B]|uniref:translocation/assembly module TamB domain-containing protein n=1 Tax=Methylocaldum sp. 14B TaxID=1912213 RepID=UPI00098AC942|nr:translocation/assembly module TamB domain-containing protein [Methylocaldum sp. 14B]